MNLVKEPIYQQLKTILRQLIHSQDYSVGDQFITERAICETYNVSRATAGKALTALVSEGYLEFRKGVGSFVAGRQTQFDLQSLNSFTAMAGQLNKKPEARVIQFKTVRGKDAGENVCRCMQLTGSDLLLFCERIRLLDGKATLLDRRYINESLCPGLSEQDASGSLISVWTERYGLDIGCTEQTVKAAALTGRDAGMMNRNEGDCFLQLSSLGLLGNGIPLWFEESLFPGDQFVMKLTRPVKREFIDIGNSQSR